MEEEYHRFLAKLPATLSAADRERIQALSESVATLWHAAGTSALDRKQIVRCVVERVIVVADKSTRAERRDDRLAGRHGDPTSGRSPRRQL